MDLEQVIRNRRTIHSFKPDLLDESLVEKAIELATYAPNHHHTHPWKFFSVSQDLRLAVAELAIQLKEKKQESALTDIQQKALREKFSRVPTLLAIGQKIAPGPKVQKEDYASIACGIQNVALFLWQFGIGTKWSTGAVTTHEKIYELLRVDPEFVELVGFLWMGFPESIPKMRPRPKLEDTLK